MNSYLKSIKNKLILASYKTNCRNKFGISINKVDLPYVIGHSIYTTVVSPLQMIVRVYGESGGDDDPLVTDVPVTPDTTCRDVIECCRDPGEEQCALVETWGPGCGEYFARSQ
jgi:hypothetical protein